jgi:chromosome segregation ATPase
MLRLLNLAKHSAFVLTGVTIGAALWKARSDSAATGQDSGPIKQSVADLEVRLAAIESSSAQHQHAGEASHNNSAETLAAVASLEATVASLTTRYDSRLSTLETHVKDHEAKLKELPTLAQVVSTMEEMLSSTMSGLDQKLSDQVKSIEVLKTTVAQSDELMERVLDSIYSLQSHVAENDKSEVPVSV